MTSLITYQVFTESGRKADDPVMKTYSGSLTSFILGWHKEEEYVRKTAEDSGMQDHSMTRRAEKTMVVLFHTDVRIQEFENLQEII